MNLSLRVFELLVLLSRVVHTIFLPYEQMSEAMSPAYTAAMHFIGGTLGGMTGVASSYPLDTIKVRYALNLAAFCPMNVAIVWRNCKISIIENPSISSN